ncbi:hypothetical protein BDR22DRAFT_970721 [Usnea florida]
MGGGGRDLSWCMAGNNEHAERRNIREIICVSEEPREDLENEGLTIHPDLEDPFTLGIYPERELLSVIDELCAAIDVTLEEGGAVLVLDIGAGVAAMAAYLMKRFQLSLVEAMTAITRARFRRPKPTPLPSERIIDMLHNDYYLKQLEIWEVCEYNMIENDIVNPSEPREKWIVERKQEVTQKKGHGISRAPDERLAAFVSHPHRLSDIMEVEEEVHRLSAISEK